MRGWNPLVPLVLVAAIVACEGLPTQTDTPQEPDTALYKKGGGGKPGGGDATLPNPVIAFSEGGVLWVMNEDGAQQKRIQTGDASSAWHPTWAPDGDGTAQDPYRIIFDSDDALWTVDLWVADGTVNHGIPDRLIMLESPCEGAWEPDWGPGGEILFGSKVFDSPSYLWRWAICVISEADLPTPRPTVLYLAEHGVTEADGHTVGRSVWSPSGDAIAFDESHEFAPYESESSLRVIDRATGALTIILDSGLFPGAGWGMDWSSASSPGTLAYAFEVPAPRGITWEIHSLELGIGADGTYFPDGGSSALATGFAFPTWSADATQVLVSDLKSLKTARAADGSVLATLTRRDGRSSDWRK